MSDLTDGEFAEEEAFMPPEMTGELAELMEMIRRAPASELRALRKRLAGQIPGFLFDTLVESARKGTLPPLPPPLPPLPPRRPLPPKPARPGPLPPDSNQLNLF